MLKFLKSLPLAEIDGMRAGRQLVDFHSGNDIAACCLKSEAQATTAGEEIKNPRTCIRVGSETGDLRGYDHRRLHVALPGSPSTSRNR
jgi:hypothetical protein